MPIVPTDNDNGQAAGSLTGFGGVAADGAATYTVPLWVPPGRGTTSVLAAGSASMTPALAFDYNSNRGNGLLGVGWALTGLSQITRTPRTYLTDGEPREIQFDESDAFALDGQRLMPVGSPLGPGGVEYRTQQDIHAKITPVGSDALGPLAFLLFAKNGLIYTYGSPGGDEGSYLQGERLNFGYGSTPSTPGAEPVRYAWALSRIEDRCGNYIAFQYEPFSGELGCGLIATQIVYTASMLPGAPPPTRLIKFSYCDRPDKLQSYTSGLLRVMTQLLAAIEVFYQPPDGSPASLVRTYSLTYEQGSNTGRSRLTQIGCTDGDGVALGPTDFTWTDQNLSFSDTVANGLLTETNPMPDWITTGDFAGTGTWSFFSGYQGLLPDEPHADDPYSLDFPAWTQYADLNCDGVAEALGIEYYSPPSGPFDLQGGWPGITLPPPQGDGPAYVGTFGVGGYEVQLPPSAIPPIMSAVDLSGDGLPDVVVSTSTVTFPDPGPGDAGVLAGIFRLNHRGELTSTDRRPELWGESVRPSWTLKVGDSLPSGASSAVGQATGAIGVSLLAPTAANSQPLGGEKLGDGRYQPRVDGLVATDPAVAIDLNGSGKTSLVWGMTALSSGSGPTATNVPLLPGVLADLNGDGLVDFVTAGANPGEVLVYINTGTGFLLWGDGPIAAPFSSSSSFSTTFYYSYNDPSMPLDGIRAVDIDSDGCDELLVMSGYCPAGSETRELFYLKLTDDPAQPLQPFPLNIPAGQQAEGLSYGQLWTAWQTSQIFKATVTAPGALVNGGATDGMPGFLQIIGGDLHVYHQQGVRPDLLWTITDGLGGSEEFDYTPICDPAVYTASDQSRYPVRVLTGGPWVVSTHTVDAGARSYQFSYETAMLDVAGGGWLGFEKRTMADPAHDAKTVTVYASKRRVETWHPYRGWPTQETTVTDLSGHPDYLSRQQVTSYRYESHVANDGRTYAPYLAALCTTVAEQTAPDAPFEKISEVVSTFTVDGYGNIVESVTDSYACADGHPLGRPMRTLLAAEYDNFPVTWLLGQLRRTKGTGVTRAGRTRTRTAEYQHDQTSGLLRAVMFAPDATGEERRETQLFTRLTRDAYGLTTGVSLTGSGRTITGTVSYEAGEHLFPEQITNALGQSASQTYESSLGVLGSVTDANNCSAVFSYDGFAGLRRIQADGGTDVTVHYLGLWAGEPLSVTVDWAGAPSARTDYDKLGRAVARGWQRFDGQQVSRKFAYDAVGRLSSASLPAGAAEPQVERTYTWDNLDRILQIQDAGLPATQFSYSGLTISQTDPNGNVTNLQMDVLARIKAVTEIMADGSELRTVYRYGPFGDLESVIDPADRTVLALDYDVAGRVKEMRDSDRGITRLVHNAFGDLTETTDAAGESVKVDTDDLGRPTSVTDASGASSLTWDTAAHGIGRIAAIANPSGAVTTYGYDAAARLNRITTTLKGKACSAGFFYDPVGRLSRISYPTLTRAPFEVTRGYNGAGYLATLTDRNGTQLWTCVSLDSLGHLRQERFASGVSGQRTYTPLGWTDAIEVTGPGPRQLENISYQYDNNGNVLQRNSVLPDGTTASETFAYDSLNRLLTWQREVTPPGGTATKETYTYEYTPVGNLSGAGIRSNIGSWTAYSYGQAGAGEHALTAATAGGVTVNYGYNAAGDQITAPNRTVQFTSYGLPTVIDQAAAGGGGRTQAITFDYDALHRRITKAGTGWSTAYIPELYELRTTPAGSQEVCYLRVGSRLLAQHVTPLTESSGRTVPPAYSLYLHDDDLTSIVVVSDDAGSAIGAYSYEPFGARTVAWQATGSSAALAEVHRGFTGHEHDDEVGLINMRGRMFDPATGRFLTADPYVPQPLSSQSYNRYSYGLNNPINRTDPSGFQDDGDDDDGAGSGPYGGSSPYPGGSGVSGSGAASSGSGATGSGTAGDLGRSWDFDPSYITGSPSSGPPPPTDADPTGGPSTLSPGPLPSPAAPSASATGTQAGKAPGTATAGPDGTVTDNARSLSAMAASPDPFFVKTLGLEHNLALPLLGPVGVGYLVGGGLYHDPQTGLGAYYVFGYGLTAGAETGGNVEVGFYPSLEDLFGKGLELGAAGGYGLSGGLNFSFDPDADMHPAGFAVDVGPGGGLAGWALKSHTRGVNLLPPFKLPDLQDLLTIMNGPPPFFGGP
jgi:RHS repeat-associated protein